MKQRGFTVIEILIVIVLLGVGSWLFFAEKSRVDATARDLKRKTAINAMYYNLEEVFYQKNKFYPTSIDEKNLRAMDPELFKDPAGVKVGDTSSTYRYEGTGCSTDGKCTGYNLKAQLELEEDYTKHQRSGN